jgi:uncharacterized membrane protein (DUF4010 family)
MPVRIERMLLTANDLTGLGVALGCGLLIGAERERSKGSGPGRAFVGVRSFALVALTGALAQCLSSTLVAVSALLVMALSVVSHWRDRSDDPGVTTELSLFLVFLLGVNAIDNPAVSAGASVIVAALLNLRGPLHHFIRVTLKSGELRDALILAGAALVVWPLLPDQANVWLLGANPRRMWGLVLLIMCLQAFAHIALRIIGPRMGLPLSGLASGFVSSTATTVAMGQRYRREPSLLGACAAAAMLSNVATYLLLVVVILAIAPSQLPHLAPALGCALLATLVIAAYRLHAAQRSAPRRSRTGRAFSIRQALLFAAILSAATALVAYAHAYLGPAAARLGAMLAALVDVHAAASSIVSLAGSGALPPPELRLTFLLALSANTGSKLVAAALSGGRPYFKLVAPGLLLILLAAWLPVWLL